MTTFHTIAGRKIAFFGKVRGANTDKFNRVAKIAASYSELIDKLDRMINAGIASATENSRLALAAKLLLTTGVRIGNEESADGYQTVVHPNNKTKVSSFVQTYGLATLLPEHLVLKNGKATLEFSGKSQVANAYRIADKSTVAQLTELATWSMADGTLLGVSPYKITKFIKRSVGSQFSPKDFRTFRANVDAYEFAVQLFKRPLPTTKKALNTEVREVLVHVSEVLCNTPAVCKSAYIDPCFIDFITEKRWN